MFYPLQTSVKSEKDESQVRVVRCSARVWKYNMREECRMRGKKKGKERKNAERYVRETRCMMREAALGKQGL